MNVYIRAKDRIVTIACIFQFGNIQAVHLPKEFRFKTDQVEIFRQGDDIVLRETPASAAAIYDALAALPADLLDQGRGDVSKKDAGHRSSGPYTGGTS